MTRRRKLPIINVDEGPQNADWVRSRWPVEHIPPYKSEAFMEMLRSWGTTLEQFRELPVYRFAVEQGRIVNDKWLE